MNEIKCETMHAEARETYEDELRWCTGVQSWAQGTRSQWTSELKWVLTAIDAADRLITAADTFGVKADNQTVNDIIIDIAQYVADSVWATVREEYDDADDELKELDGLDGYDFDDALNGLVDEDERVRSIRMVYDASYLSAPLDTAEALVAWADEWADQFNGSTWATGLEGQLEAVRDALRDVIDAPLKDALECAQEAAEALAQKVAASLVSNAEDLLRDAAYAAEVPGITDDSSLAEIVQAVGDDCIDSGGWEAREGVSCESGRVWCWAESRADYVAFLSGGLVEVEVEANMSLTP